MKIGDIHTPWRDAWVTASFRGVQFFVENNARQGGRRVALHQYPKRNLPYAEDMGRSANQFSVHGYLIGPNYLQIKDRLVDALEKDGPGTLVLPLQYKLTDVNVMVATYAVTESRERGGMCVVEMTFVEYGDPAFRQTPSAPVQVQQSADNVDKAVVGPQTKTEAEKTDEEIKQYNDAFVIGYG